MHIGGRSEFCGCWMHELSGVRKIADGTVLQLNRICDSLLFLVRVIIVETINNDSGHIDTSGSQIETFTNFLGARSREVGRLPDSCVPHNRGGLRTNKFKISLNVVGPALHLVQRQK